MRKLVLSSLRARKASTFTLVLSVAASAAMLFALALMYTGVSQGVALSEERGGAELVVVPEEADAELSDAALLFTGLPTPMYFDASAVGQARQIEGVARVSPQFYSQSLHAECCDTDDETRIIGFDPQTDWVVSPLCEVDLSQGLADDEVLIGSKLDPLPDGTINLLGKTYKVAAQLAATGSDIDQCILVDIDVARDMSRGVEGFEHYWEDYGDPSGLVSTLLVDLDDGLSKSKRAAALSKLKKLGDLRVIERSSVIESSQESLSAVFAVLLAAGVVMLVVTVLQLLGRFGSMAWDRKSELALYRAVGATRRQIALVIGMEAGVVVGVGVACGVVLGLALYLAGNAWLSGLEAFPFVAPGAPVFVACTLVLAAAFLLVALVSILVPIRQIGRIDPSLAMQQSDIG